MKTTDPSLFPHISEDQVISVSIVNQMAKKLLELCIPASWISGEISNWIIAASGHAYFSLKDEQSQVRCVLFRQQLNQLTEQPCNGMHVEVKGTVSLYTARGEYQINIFQLRNAGLGKLYEAFLQLKNRLQTEGLFAMDCKLSLPKYPYSIGVVTSHSAAALRDIITTLKRRMPVLSIILYPTPVQGEGAGRKIAAAIREASNRNEVDVLLICRGGGSIEDLWAFNEECVAREIAACRIPTVSGIGHETDFTICDFVVDQRAPTPTAAAELVSPDKTLILKQLKQIQQSLLKNITNLLNTKIQYLDYLINRLTSPKEKLRQQQDTLTQLTRRLRQLMKYRFTHQQQLLTHLRTSLHYHKPEVNALQKLVKTTSLKLVSTFYSQWLQRSEHFSQLQSTLQILNPESILKRGYAIVETPKGKIITSAKEIKRGERIKLHFKDSNTEAIIDPPAIQENLPI